MRKILIVGAGQAGLQLAIGLQARGYEITLVSNRTAEEIQYGKVLSSQAMYHDALQCERVRGINFWEEECPDIEGTEFTMGDPEHFGLKVMNFSHRVDHKAQSVDQRVKIPRWITEFSKRGGDILFKEASIDDLEQWTRTHDLVIVAAGKGEIARLFLRDASRSPYDKPQRALGLTYVHGMEPRSEYRAVRFNAIPGIGEYFVVPGLTNSGPCDIMVFEGVPNGPMDCWRDVATPGDHLNRSLEILRRFVPWEAERCAKVELTDANGILSGAFPPTVRHVVGRLPSGRVVMGMGDAVLINDPITGQGAGTAAKTAAAVEEAVLEHGAAPFDVEFMRNTFERFWHSYGRYATNWTNGMLRPQPHALKILAAASASPAVARRFVNGFNNPVDFAEFFLTPDAVDTYLTSVAV